MKSFKQYILESTDKKIVSATGINGSGKTTVTYEDGSTATLTGPRPIRNNNPGNLEYGPFARSQGAVGSDGRYAVFPTKQTGWNAKINLLKTQTYQRLTLKDAFNRYAPPSENPNYLRDLKTYTGFDLNRPMNSLSDSEFQTLVNAVAKIEGAGDYVNKFATTAPSGQAAPDYTGSATAESESTPDEEGKMDFTSIEQIAKALKSAYRTLGSWGR
jgi:hypothetical protein